MATPKPPVIAIDFDRVIHDIDHPVEGRKMGPPMEGATQVLQMLADRGVAVDVFTVRATTDRGRLVVEDWLKYYLVQYRLVTATKQSDWKMIIDDLAREFIDWNRVAVDTIAVAGLDESNTGVEFDTGQQQKPNKSAYESIQEAKSILELAANDNLSSTELEDNVNLSNSTPLDLDYKPKLVPCSFCGGRGYRVINAMGGRSKCTQCGGTGKVPAT